MNGEMKQSGMRATSWYNNNMKKVPGHFKPLRQLQVDTFLLATYLLESLEDFDSSVCEMHSSCC